MFYKYFLVFFAVYVMANAIALNDQEQFAEFKQKFQKSYESPEEDKNRFKIFQENLRKIEEHNKKYEKGETTYTMGINQFSDMSPEEWANKNHGYRPRPNHQ
ncbi:unnamed protein product [Diabrotica balteata]|uniref:Cathepsin propeptide inhibitor domain-containing protein n=2 Tax=Diabrotica balteata TaxID=107213 RepID=A0A9N9T0U9_DIABA|nr:unnamed protein product [Diabrotica balteata]